MLTGRSRKVLIAFHTKYVFANLRVGPGLEIRICSKGRRTFLDRFSGSVYAALGTLRISVTSETEV